MVAALATANVTTEVPVRRVKRRTPGSINVSLIEVVDELPGAAQSAGSSTSSPSVKPHERDRLSDLLAKHAAAMAELTSIVRVSPLYDPQLHDDVWLLRFLLSHLRGGASQAASAALSAMAFRKAHGLDSSAVRPPCGGPEALKLPAVAKLYGSMRSTAAVSFFVPDAQRGAVTVAVPALIDFHRAAASLSEEEQSLAHLLATEWLYLQCDAVTRRTGYLTKSARLIDLHGMKLSGISREFQRRNGRDSKALEDCYPQLLGAVFLCHAPTWLNVVWRTLIRPMMPPRVLEKVDFLTPLTSERDRRRLHAYLAEEHLPECFGGPCTVWPPPNSRFAYAHLSDKGEGAPSATHEGDYWRSGTPYQ